MSAQAQLGAGARGATAVALCCTAALAPLRAQASETTATMSASIQPDRLGARASFTVAIRYTATQKLPEPLRRAVIFMPADLALSVPLLRSCGVRRLREHGPRSCPPASRIGEGRARAEAHLGSQTLSEDVRLSIFLGPLRENPTFAILAAGHTPLDERIALSGVMLPTSSSYGEKLAMSIPPIHTLPLQPDASIASLTLTVGTVGRPHRRRTSAIVVPSHCPEGGFPLMARFTYADGTAGEAHTAVECPPTRG